MASLYWPAGHCAATSTWPEQQWPAGLPGYLWLRKAGLLIVRAAAGQFGQQADWSGSQLSLLRLVDWSRHVMWDGYDNCEDGVRL